MDVKVRFGKIADFKQVRLFDPHSEYIDPNKIKIKLNQKEIILALSENKIVGLIKFSYFWSTRPYLDLIYVEKSFRNSGVGRELLQFLENYLVKNGYSYLFTSSEYAEKEPQAWHQRMGFKTCGILDKINLPHTSTKEIFFYKRIATGNPKNDHLKKYPITKSNV